MPIIDTEKSCFLLSGKNYSYCMYINRAGLLQHLYWGKKIDTADAAFLVAALMGAGLFYPRLHDCGSWVWHIEEVREEG